MAVHYFDPQRNSFRVTGNTFILAANGIESPKLLYSASLDNNNNNNLANSPTTPGTN